MKSFICLFVSCVFFLSMSLGLNSQIMESDYVREGSTEAEVLGLETEEAVVEEVEEKDVDTSRIIDIFAVLGGVVVIALFAYIVYSKKEK